MPQYGLRGEHIEAFATTTRCKNPRWEGAAAPSTTPSNFGSFPGSGNGITREIVGTGTEDGIPYIDLRFYGTATAQFETALRMGSTTETPAAIGDIWTQSVYARIVSGTTTGFTTRFTILEINSSGGQVAASDVFFVAGTGPLRAQRYSGTRTFTNAATAYVLPGMAFRFVNGSTVDLIIRLGAPQAEARAAPSSVVLPPVGSPGVTTRAADDQTLPAGFSLAEGTVMLDIGYLRNGATTAFGTVFGLGIAGSGSPTSTNRIGLYGGNTPNFVIADSTGTQAIFSVGSLADTLKRVALTWRHDDAQACVDGVLSAVDTSVGLPTSPASVFRVGGSNISATNGAGVWIRRIRRWPMRLTPEQLQLITTTS